MVDYKNEHFLIRKMKEEDIKTIELAFKAQGWTKDKDTLRKYYHEQQASIRQVLIAEVDGQVAGYITLKVARHGPFVGEYEARDFNVFMPYRHQKIGYRLLCAAEKEVFTKRDCITLAVGLHEGYGNAQRLYIRNGYIPDGSGVWYQNQPLQPYTKCVNDDDLVLYLRKERDNNNGKNDSGSLGSE